MCDVILTKRKRETGSGSKKDTARTRARARERERERGREEQPGGFPLGVCTRHFSKQLDSDRCTAYVPEESVREGEKESERKGWKLIVEYLLMTS